MAYSISMAPYLPPCLTLYTLPRLNPVYPTTLPQVEHTPNTFSSNGTNISECVLGGSGNTSSDTFTSPCSIDGMKVSDI